MLSSSIFVYALALVASVTPQLAHAVPLTDGLAPRGPQSFSLPDLTKYLNPSAGNKAGCGAASSCPSTGGGDLTQKTLCSTGTSYCCVSEARGNTCIDATTKCDHTVVCCNNANGSQMCMGDVNFNMPMAINMPININIGVPSKNKDGKMRRSGIQGLHPEGSSKSSPINSVTGLPVSDLVLDLLKTTQ
ncbi:hypothetical protein MCOR27_001648 [Pyricularia oryzae]|uniref:Hydrophobin n=1 Tax=Pyricularia grisea TaxID=148305 RepID=A0ABQ8NXD8_PYRGI|nr:hypothetical protein MCOR01_011221 [Pyricularia oryzae]KAI6303239.1 hypothetical protein MCOR33_001505 [Pyricularia grisea]KAH9437701.1 hypothetical protein MCOR02_001354 [Pyricularia oryzae]KAI6256585.1 hypothetical protein MCOR19_006956 [Pyricularia oryzae]KAI6285133.1 hypothetical protein MCOR26_001624 [Pyricularia oryzae]